MPTCSCCGSAPTRRGFAVTMGALLAVSALPRPSRAATSPAPALEPWFAKNPQIGNAILWDTGSGVLGYKSWPADLKAGLGTVFEAAWNERPSGLPDPPANLETLADTQFWTTSLGPADAFALYARAVGNSLALEIGKRLPWSVTGYDDQMLAQLFDGRTMFKRNTSPDRYTVVDWDTPCPPDTALRFLAERKLVGKDRRSTLVNLIDWSRRLYHFIGGPDAKNGELHWGYRGAPPASRVISGTSYAGPHPTGGMTKPRHYTAGCHGTTGFYRAVLRAINIPVQRMTIFERMEKGGLGAHSAPFFMSEGLYLTHGDDPYNANCRYEPTFPMSDLLIDKAKFASWFPTNAPPKARTDTNVSRQVYELAIERPTIYLLNEYAEDLATGSPHEAGKVFASLKSLYVLAELDRRQLWPRLDAALAKLGGPQAVMQAYKTSLAQYDAASVAGS